MVVAQHRASADLPAPEAPRQRSLARNTGWQALTLFVPLLINLALTPYVIAGLGTSEYGVYLVAIAVQAFCASLTGGAGVGANRFFGLYVGRGDVGALTRLFTSLLLVVSCLAAVFGLALGLAAPAVVGFFPSTAVDPDGAVFLVRTLVVLLAVYQVRSLFLELLFVHQRFALYSLAVAVGTLAYAVGMVVTVRTGAGLEGVAWSFIVQAALPTFVVVPAALRHVAVRELGLAPWAVLRDYAGYTWKLQSTTVLETFSLQSDTVIVGRLASSQLTPFGAGAQFALTLRTLALSAQVPLFSRLGRLVGSLGAPEAGRDAVRLQRLWVRGVSGYVCLGAPAAYAGVTAWLDLGTDLPGRVALVMFLGHGFWLLGLVQSTWALVLGRSGLTLVYQLVNLALNVSLTLVLIGPFGVLGTASATLLAQASALIVLVALTRRLDVPLRAPWLELRPLALLACTALSWFTQNAASSLTPGLVPHGPLSLVLHGLVLVPVLALYAWWAIGPDLPQRVRQRVGPRDLGRHRA